MVDLLQAVPTWLVALYVGLVGLVVGSYLNVVVYRLPRGMSTVRPRSTCPACEQLIPAYDNIPVVSFLVLRGRCRKCGHRISGRYPLVEAATGSLFALSIATFGVTWNGVTAIVFCALLLPLALIDLEHYLLPDRLTYPGIALGLALSFVNTLTTPKGALLASLFGAAILLAIIGLWYLVRKERGMGLGDVKMLAMIGAFLGAPATLLTLFFASLSGSIIGVALILSGRLGGRAVLPFGVFLAIGAAVTLFFGRPLIESYLTLL